MGKEKAVIFTREYKKRPDAQMKSELPKWKTFFDMIEQSKGKVEYVIVAAPEVLGDTYEEIVVNLAAIYNAELKVIILPSEVRGESIRKQFI